MYFNKVETPILYDNLGRPLDLENTDQTLWNDKCNYQDIETLNPLNGKDENLTLLQLNIRSLLGKQDDIILFLNKLYEKKVFQK